MSRIRQIYLTEHESARFPQDMLTPAQGHTLWQSYDLNGRKLTVTFPTPKTNEQWEITPTNWVGTIPISSQLHLNIQPKTPLQNIFHMWEYAYHLHQFRFFDDLIRVETIQDFFDHLAAMLSRLVLHRARLGLHRAYIQHQANLAFVRGRLMVPNQPVATNPTLRCQYDDHTADISDNQLLLFTLDQIARSGTCRPETQQVVRQAHHLLAGMVTLRPFTPRNCTNRSYTRLNEDYRPMHALCRFFLEHSGPTHTAGTHHMKPFLVNMPRLFEQFVAAWLQHHLPAPWRLSVQESVHVGKHNELRFDIDLVLYDENGHSYAVLDTKYKKAATFEPADIHQIITYAHAKKAPRAILIYPTQPETPLQVQFGDTTLETVSFSLAGDLQQSGMTFLNNMITSKNSLTQFSHSL